MKVRRLLIGSMALAVLGLAAACGGGDKGADPTPTPVVVQPGRVTVEPWTIEPARPGAIDLRAATKENLDGIKEAVERHEELRVQWNCTLSLEGLPLHEVATERWIARIDELLEPARARNVCESIDLTVKPYYTVLSANQADVYAEERGVSRYFDRATGQEVKPPEPFDMAVGFRLVKGEDGRWRVDGFGRVPRAGEQQ